jgi:ribose transport system substrate-binding protein
MYIAGGGATTEAVEGIQQGTWDATAVNFPFSEGSLATTEIIKALRGEDYNQVIDITQEGSIPVSVVTAETLEQYPDWEPEWDG